MDFFTKGLFFRVFSDDVQVGDNLFGVTSATEIIGVFFMLILHLKKRVLYIFFLLYWYLLKIYLLQTFLNFISLYQNLSVLLPTTRNIAPLWFLDNKFNWSNCF